MVDANGPALRVRRRSSGCCEKCSTWLTHCTVLASQLFDDLGWNDLGSYSSPESDARAPDGKTYQPRTPLMDELMSECA